MKRDVHADARLLGGEAAGTQILCPGPGHSRSDRSLSLHRSVKSPLGYWFTSFAGDSFERCADHIRGKLGLPEFKPGAYKPPVEKPDPEPEDPEPTKNQEYARKIWREAVTVTGSLAEDYLYRERGLRLGGSGYYSGSHYLKLKRNTEENIPYYHYDLIHGNRYWSVKHFKHPACFDWSDVLRFHQKLRFDGKTTPGMVALMRDIETREGRAIHRTYLSKSGLKITRRMLGPAKGCAIMLDYQVDGPSLSIGEGLETTLAGRAMGYAPAWAVGSAAGIAAFPVIPSIEKLFIFAENDGGANEAAIHECRDRWTAAGKKVIAVRPPREHKDLNDAWLALGAQPHEDRKESFLDICQGFWPGAELASDPIQDSVLAMLDGWR